jgi:prepilin-type N-terminal cleavage/methylation domain-containing protein
MKQPATKKNGFTLIELIVVITIMAVLTVIGVVNYTGASKRSRDGRRMADLQQIRMALEMYRQEKGVYPADCGTSEFKKYLEAWPLDPKLSEPYVYALDVGSSYAYSIMAHMEDLGSTNIAETGTCGAVGSGIKCNYKVINP